MIEILPQENINTIPGEYSRWSATLTILYACGAAYETSTTLGCIMSNNIAFTPIAPEAASASLEALSGQPRHLREPRHQQYFAFHLKHLSPVSKHKNKKWAPATYKHNSMQQNNLTSFSTRKTSVTYGKACEAHHLLTMHDVSFARSSGISSRMESSHALIIASKPSIWRNVLKHFKNPNEAIN
jgi:hypothetical protein